MSEENKVTQLNQNQQKDPKQSAINQLKETAAKDFNKKIQDQMKKVHDAYFIFKKELEMLQGLQLKSEEDKVLLDEFIKMVNK